MSDAVDGTSMRARVGVSPGTIAKVTEPLGDLNAASAPGGGAVVAARSAGMHETFVTSKLETESARTSKTRPYPSVAHTPITEPGCCACSAGAPTRAKKDRQKGTIRIVALTLRCLLGCPDSLQARIAGGKKNPSPFVRVIVLQ